MADGNKETNFICKMIGLDEIIITDLSQLCPVVSKRNPPERCGIPEHPGPGCHGGSGGGFLIFPCTVCIQFSPLSTC